jgi:hypothetical protein
MPVPSGIYLEFREKVLLDHLCRTAKHRDQQAEFECCPLQLPQTNHLGAANEKMCATLFIGEGLNSKGSKHYKQLYLLCRA